MTASVADKLRIKPGASIWLTPPDRLGLIGPLPDGAGAVADPAAASVAIVVADDGAAVRAALDRHAEAIRYVRGAVGGLPQGQPDRHQP